MRRRKPIEMEMDSYSDADHLPERRLLASILLDAAVTLNRPDRLSKLYTTSTKGRIMDETENWVRDKRSYDILSFRFICDYLGLDADLTRRNILKGGLRSTRGIANIRGGGC